jgi:hypothetical protein
VLLLNEAPGTHIPNIQGIDLLTSQAGIFKGKNPGLNE